MRVKNGTESMCKKKVVVASFKVLRYYPGVALKEPSNTTKKCSQYSGYCKFRIGFPVFRQCYLPMRQCFCAESEQKKTQINHNDSQITIL